MAATVGLFIQARSNSERLPGKIYAGLPEPGDAGLIEHLFRRMSRVRGADVVAVLVPAEDELLIEFLRSREIPHFAGPEQDVRARYREAARHYGVEFVVRATGDNPLTDPVVAADTILALRESGADLLSFSNLPLGLAVESFCTRALLDDTCADTPEYREHVSLHIKHNPERFLVSHPQHPCAAGHIASALPRLTVDTAQDLAVVRRVFRELGPDAGTPAILELWVRQRDLFAGNAQVEQRSFARPAVHASLSRESVPARGAYFGTQAV